MIEKNQKIKYLLPNLITTSGILFGLMSIIYSIDGNFIASVITIYFAIICDYFDGKIARLTNTQTSFGIEYDSLSDMLNFGVAPGILAYNWLLAGYNKITIVASFIYIVSVAVRLARFNANNNSHQSFFQGMPSPGGAFCFASFVWLSESYSFTPSYSLVLCTVLLLIFLSFLMCSNIPFPSFKKVDIKNYYKSFIAFLSIFFILLYLVDFPLIFFIIATIYVLTSLFSYINQRWLKNNIIGR